MLKRTQMKWYHKCLYLNKILTDDNYLKLWQIKKSMQSSLAEEVLKELKLQIEWWIGWEIGIGLD